MTAETTDPAPYTCEPDEPDDLGATVGVDSTTALVAIALRKRWIR